MKYNNNGIFEVSNLFLDGILCDDKLPKKLILELLSGVFFKLYTEFIISNCAVLQRKKEKILDPPRCTKPVHHEASDQNVSCLGLVAQFTSWS